MNVRKQLIRQIAAQECLRQAYQHRLSQKKRRLSDLLQNNQLVIIGGLVLACGVGALCARLRISTVLKPAKYLAMLFDYTKWIRIAASF